MVDNVVTNAGAGGATIASDDVAGVHYQRVKLVDGTADSTAAIPGDAANGLDVDVTRLPSLPAGTNNIGDVDVLTLPAIPAGNNNIGDVDVASLPATALAAGNLVQADYDTGAGTQNMPLVGLALPASGGAVAGGTATNPVRVDPTGTTAQPVSGTVTANAGSGNFSTNLAQVVGTAAAVGNGAASAGCQRVTIASDNTAFSVNATLQASTNTNEVVGDAAHDAPVAGNPVLCGAEARTLLPTAVANGDAVRNMADKNGRLVVTNEAPRDLVTQNRLALTATTETTLIAAGGVGVLRDLTHLVMSNESATECRVDIRDATAGSVVLSVDLAADGGGAVVPFPKPMKQTTANNNWTAQLSAAVSTMYISAQAVDAN
ncbi:MAG: hypothetical protein ACT4O5_15735 [Gammaproteobacteria bacterium]